MQKLSKMESFKGFQISKQSMNRISGARTKYFEAASSDSRYECAKVIDDNDGNRIKYKERTRYSGC